ncbi:hypothetical protein P4S68_13895 [Pseudoalteromonas sp. Hal099]
MSSGQTELNFWYSWDYFGTGAGHVISMIAHTFESARIMPFVQALIFLIRLMAKKWAWDVNQKKSYKHYRLAYQTSYEGFGIEIAAEDTSLDYDYADERIVLAISRISIYKIVVVRFYIQKCHF